MNGGKELLAHLFRQYVIGDLKALKSHLEAFTAATESNSRTHVAPEDDPSLPPATMGDPDHFELTPEPSPVSSGTFHDRPRPWVRVTEHAGQVCFIMPVDALVQLATDVATRDFHFPLWSGLQLVGRFGFQEFKDGRWIQAQLEKWRAPSGSTKTEFYAVRYDAERLRFQIVPGSFEDARQQIAEGIENNPTRYRRLPPDAPRLDPDLRDFWPLPPSACVATPKDQGCSPSLSRT